MDSYTDNALVYCCDVPGRADGEVDLLCDSFSSWTSGGGLPYLQFRELDLTRAGWLHSRPCAVAVLFLHQSGAPNPPKVSTVGNLDSFL